MASSKNVELNQLTTIWGDEPRPGESTYTLRGGKRVQQRPTIDDLRAPTMPSHGRRTSQAAALFAKPGGHLRRSGHATMSVISEAAGPPYTPESSVFGPSTAVPNSTDLFKSPMTTPFAESKGGGGELSPLNIQTSLPDTGAGTARASVVYVRTQYSGRGRCACLVSEPAKLGMWEGVFARCLLNIFGVIMFLRIPWLVAYAGFWHTLLIMIISVTITSISSLSLSAICTNGEIKRGGAYYLISRALGPEFGGSIGIMFYIGNAIGVAMYHIGFAETVVSIAGGVGSGPIIAEGWDARIIAIIALAVVLCIKSAAIIVKVQLGLLAVLAMSLILFFVGCFIEHPEIQAFAGPIGSTLSRFQDNMNPDYSRSQVYAGNFTCPHPLDPVNNPGNNWTATNTLANLDGTVNFGVALGIFFPAVTGIMAGANVSGDLKDPSSAIPFGTNLAIIVSTCVYFLLALFVSFVSIRSVPGIITGDNCPFGGSFHDYVFMARIAAWPPIFYAGIFASTISSGIASLVSAPRILQAIANDKIFPGMGWLAKTFGPNEEPLAGYVFTCAIAVFSIIALDLNSVAPLITNFFMCSYALTNFACFMADVSRR